MTEDYDFGYDPTPVVDWFDTCEHDVPLSDTCKACDAEAVR